MRKWLAGWRLFAWTAPLALGRGLGIGLAFGTN